ncbi:MAG TPA: amidohydrolase family protein [Longimicrobiaceae bacterium]|nr:amidohydrolase family protein [Longimicrobiaceae bacterium]
MTPPRIDVHVHLAGVGAGGSGCWLSPRFSGRLVFRLLRRLYRITEAQMRESVDQEWAAWIAERVRASELDGAVVLGFDGVYDARGELDRERSQMVVPPSWVLEVCRRHPELLPGPAVNPYRRDALERLEECIEGGAVLIKWLPSAMGIDPADPRLRPFYRRMAEARLPLLSHSGGSERTFAEVAPECRDLRCLRLPLEEGVPVICAHNGVPVHLSRDPDQLPLLREMLREFPHLWVDNSGISNPSRFAHLPRLARDPEFTERTLYGSDYPIPSLAVYYVRELGARRVRSLQAERNPFQRDVALKRALGYPDATLTRAAEVLPTLRGRAAGR